MKIGPGRSEEDKAPRIHSLSVALLAGDGSMAGARTLRLQPEHRLQPARAHLRRPDTYTPTRIVAFARTVCMVEMRIDT
mgnify:CR=1 FL=1|jgi:hypothetical protein